jgi:hypothetical protein
MNPKNFFTELKRRNVYKVAIAYAVVAWLLMQVIHGSYQEDTPCTQWDEQSPQKIQNIAQACL